VLHIDAKYIGLVSARLDKFKRVKDHLYTFRCPYCGDSKKNKNKTRGYIYQVKTDYNFKCHNCGESRSFTYFLKDRDRQLYDQYILERYKEGITGIGSVAPNFVYTGKKPVFKTKMDLPRATENADSVRYLTKRGLDPKDYFYAEKFQRFCNTYKPTYDNITRDHARIVIPMYSESKKLIGFQGRALDNYVQPKYLTMMLDEEHPKIYGLDKIDKKETVYVTEGPFDSTFLGNSIAMCGSDVDLGTMDYKFVFVYDNEPRSREIVSKIAKTIAKSYPVVIFPSSVHEKDLNDMHLAGQDVQNLIESNTYKGLEATLKLQTWKRV
jgi:transcription elongation factor Elf1